MADLGHNSHPRLETGGCGFDDVVHIHPLRLLDRGPTRLWTAAGLRAACIWLAIIGTSRFAIVVSAPHIPQQLTKHLLYVSETSKCR